MIYIDMSSVEPPKNWQEKANELSKKLAECATLEERNKVIDSHPHWVDFKKELHKLSYGKCWYSEAREIYSHYHVDHFRPKKRALDVNNADCGGYWWLTYDYKNYRLCGSVGNTKKGDRFPVLKHKANSSADSLKDELAYFLDPVDPDDVKLLNFDEEGKAIPANSNKDTWDYKRADLTIKWFDLDYEDLKTARRQVWKRTVDRINETQQLLQENNQNPSATITAQIRGEMDNFLKAIAPCSELSATVRCCLRSSGLDWALKLLEQKINVEVYCKEYIS